MTTSVIEHCELLVCVCGQRSTVASNCSNPKCIDPKWLTINSDAIELLDPKSTYKRSWFHGTTNPYWIEDVIDAEVPVHVGTFDAAMHRKKTLDSVSDEWFLFELEVADDATIAKGFYEDMMDEWPYYLSTFTPLAKRHDFVRYVNEVEVAGSISLLGNPEMFYVKNVFVFDEELRDFVKLND